jgi:hypothetical protein
MPTVDRWGNCRAYFYSFEPGEPPHVHVDCAEKSLKVWLHDLSLAYNDGFRSGEVRRIIARVAERRDTYLEAWHGHLG